MAKALKDTGLVVFVRVDLAVAREERRSGTILLHSTSHVIHRALELTIDPSFNFTMKCKACNVFSFGKPSSRMQLDIKLSPLK